MTTQELAHRFFHNPEMRGEYARVNTSFEYHYRSDGTRVWCYYSYSTIVAEIRQDKDKHDCLIVSDYKYSVTTAKHLRELEHACPFWPDNILYVPIVHGRRWGLGEVCGLYDFASDLRNAADKSEKHLRRKENRDYVKHVVDMYDRYVEHFKDMDKESKKIRKSRKLAKVLEIIEQKEQELEARREHIASIPDEVREANRAKREAAAQRKIEQFVNTDNLLDKLRIAFDTKYQRIWNEYRTKDEYKKAVVEWRNSLKYRRDSSGRAFSYVWIVGDHAETSQRCNAPIDDVRRLCRLWRAKDRMIGEHAGQYTVVKNTDEYVQVGCHVIPTWTVEALCNQLGV